MDQNDCDTYFVYIVVQKRTLVSSCFLKMHRQIFYKFYINTFFQFSVVVLRKGRSDDMHKTATSHDFNDDNSVSSLMMHMFLYFKTSTFMM